ncbi:MAG: hypothetical protein HC906_01205 [Bacteroidales bacterium]|nr:hypothetical protein [Bacteroidales bacterium]
MKPKIFFVLIFFVIWACKQQVNQPNAEYPSDSTMVVTPDWIKEAGIQFEIPKKRMMAEFIESVGTVQRHPESVIYVSAPIGGFLKNSHAGEGSFIQKGEILAVLEHMDIIKIQEEFLEARSQLAYLREEYKRQGELALEKASTVKKMQQAQSGFESVEARYASLKAQLQLLGIQADTLTPENMITSITLKSPANGLLLKSNAITGKYFASHEVIYELVNNNRLRIALQVRANEFIKIKPGTEIRFGTENRDYSARVTHTGTNGTDNFIELFGDIEKSDDHIVPGLKVNAFITLSKKEVVCIPKKAMFMFNLKSCVFAEKESGIKLFTVEKGISDDQFIEIKTRELQSGDWKIVVEGIQFIQEKMALKVEK